MARTAGFIITGSVAMEGAVHDAPVIGFIVAGIIGTINAGVEYYKYAKYEKPRKF